MSDNESPFSLSEKTALVTGAAHGIGKECAIALAKAGAHMAILDINLKDLKETEEKIRALGRECLPLEADITDEVEVIKSLGFVTGKFGGLDIAFCNAGVFQDVHAFDMPIEEFRRLIDVNLVGTFITARAAGRVMMMHKKGSIILTASISGHIINTPQCMAGYTASKAGVIMLGKCLAVEWAEYGIRVNTISPGYISTWSDDGMPPCIECWKELTPLKRLGRSEELTGLIQYLASDASSFVTGSDMVIDGGYTAL